MPPTEQIQKRIQDLTTQDIAQRQFFEDKFKEYKEFLEANLTIPSDQIDNYFFRPIDLGVISKPGDTLNPKTENLGYFTALIKKHLLMK